MSVLKSIISLTLCLSMIITPANLTTHGPYCFNAGSGTAQATLYGSTYSTTVSAQTNGPTPCYAKADVCGTYMGASGHRMWAYGYGEYINNGHGYSTAQFSNCDSCYWTEISGTHSVIKDGVTYNYSSHVTL